MPIVPYEIGPDSFIEISMESELNGQQNISLFHYVYTGTAIIPDGRQLALDFLDVLAGPDALYEAYLACLSSDVGQVQMYAQWIHPNRFAYVTYPTPSDADGPVGALPQNVSVAITKRGVVAARNAIGTLHMPAVPSDWVVNGQVVQPIGTPYQDLADSLASDQTVGAVTLEPVLFNRTTPADSQFIAEAFYQLTSRVDRRRTVGLGI